MRIFFTTPFSGKALYQKYIDEALAVLAKSGAAITSPENTLQYQEALKRYQEEGLRPTRAHYAFIAHGIAEADVVVIEASHASLRVGHEITLALLYGKPTLVLSQKENYADWIAHNLLRGAKYKTKKELRQYIEGFLSSDATLLSPLAPPVDPMLEAAADALRLTTYATMRQQALQDEGEFGNLADLAEHDANKAYGRIERILKSTPVEKPWSVLSSIYNEDTPDFIFTGVTKFIMAQLDKNGIDKNAHIIDALSQGGIMARNLAKAGYAQLSCFSPYREMLSKTYQLCTDYPEIRILEADIATLTLPRKASAIVWVDYTSNFTLTDSALSQQLQNLLHNIRSGGCLIFDVRLTRGWDVYFFHEKVATYATPNFQHISVNQTDDAARLIHFDRLVRLKQNTGLWGAWKREKLVGRIWSLSEIQAIINDLKTCSLQGIYDEDFSPFEGGGEPNLAYFVLKKK